MPQPLFRSLASRFADPVLRAERRAFLRASVAAAASLLLAGSEARARRGEGSGRRVIVIGGGLAGLACADELARAGCSVTVLEARARLGGRVVSFYNFAPGCAVEGGGELIGLNHPMWRALTHRFNLHLDEIPDEPGLVPPVSLQGRLLTDHEAKALYEELEAATAALNRIARGVNPDEPWTSPNAAALDARSVASFIDELNVSDLARHALRAQITADNGQEPERMSLLAQCAQVAGGGFESYWQDSETHRCAQGAQRLAQQLGLAVGRPNVLPGRIVEAVEIKDDRVVVRIVPGQRLECDQAVLAVPPSVWGRIKFDPALPAALSPQMGVNVKYLAKVTSRFWREAGRSGESLSDTGIQETWEATDSCRAGQPEDGSAVLIGFAGAGEASRLGEAARTATSADEACGPSMERVQPGFTAAFKEGRFMNWPGDAYAGAGYSFPAPGEVMTVSPLLRAGLGRLHFAGEHCSSAFVGYMEGALQSGLACAKRILA